MKSLELGCIFVPLSRVSDFVRSFPLLEDLAVFNGSDRVPIIGKDNLVPQPAAVMSSNPSPVFSGALVLSLMIEMGDVIPRFFPPLDRLSFREMELVWNFESDVWPTAGLVERCGSNLERLVIKTGSFGTFTLHLDSDGRLTDLMCRHISWLPTYRPVECDKAQRCGFHI